MVGSGQFAVQSSERFSSKMTQNSLRRKYTNVRSATGRSVSHIYITVHPLVLCMQIPEPVNMQFFDNFIIFFKVILETCIQKGTFSQIFSSYFFSC